MLWSILIPVVTLTFVAAVIWKVRRENKAISKNQHDAMDGRARFNPPEAGNQGSSVRTFNGFNG